MQPLWQHSRGPGVRWSRRSLLCMCTVLCITHVMLLPSLHAYIHICWHSWCFCTHCLLIYHCLWFIVCHSLRCSGRTSRPLCQLWVEPIKHLKQQSLIVILTVFHLSWQFRFHWNDAAQLRLAREQMKRQRHQRQMLTALARSYAWSSDEASSAYMYVSACVCLCMLLW